MGAERDYEYYSKNAQYFPPTFTVPHGCDIYLQYEKLSDTIRHIRTYDNTKPKIRSYRDGLKVGCTFIDNETLEHLYKLHKKFQTQESMDHQ